MKRARRDGRVARSRGDARDSGPYAPARLAQLPPAVLAGLMRDPNAMQRLHAAWLAGWDEAHAELCDGAGSARGAGAATTR